MYLTYRNMAKPYAVGDDNAERYYKSVTNECQLSSEEEMIVWNVFNCYDEAVWHAELIVRIPHMVAHYFNDPARLQILRSTFPSLFINYEFVVLPQVRAAIPVIKKTYRKSKHD